MSSPNPCQTQQEKMAETVSMIIPALPAYVSMIRLSLSAVASRCGFDIESIEDIKVAVAEAVTNAIVHCHSCAQHTVHIESSFDWQTKKMTITVSDDGPGFDQLSVKIPDAASLEEGGLGLFIIRSLMDDVELKTRPGQGTRIIMNKNLGDR